MKWKSYASLVIICLSQVACNGKNRATKHPDAPKSEAVAGDTVAKGNMATSTKHNKSDTTFLKKRNDAIQEPQWDKSYFGTTQYKLLQKRKKEMAAWNQQYPVSQLPEHATIIDTKTFTTAHGPRTLLASMQYIEIGLNSLENDGEEQGAWSYRTSGSGYFDGVLYLSLYDNARRQVINTVRVTYFSASGKENNDSVFYDEESIRYPIAICNPAMGKKAGFYDGVYHATGGTKIHDGEADVLHLFDFNGDGKPYEFALFVQDGGATLNSTLFGYNDNKDSLSWYPWDITYHDALKADSVYGVTETWMDRAMTFSFGKKKEIRFSVDYRGRGGSNFDYSLKYDKANDRYYGDVYVTE